MGEQVHEDNLFASFKNELDRGKAGLNAGLPMGFPRLENIIPGIQRGTNYLIFGESGTGKSSFADTVFVCNPLDWYMKNRYKTDLKLNIFYYSFEISKPRLITKLIARKIWMDHRILLDVNYILSKGMKYRITDEHYKLCMGYSRYMEEASDIIQIKDSSSGHNNPTGIYMDLIKHSERPDKGVWTEVNNQRKYVEKDPNLYTIVVTDHLGIVPREKGNTVKDNIDSLVAKQVILRNACNYSFVNISQVNRAVNDQKRINEYEKETLSLNLGDVKDSGGPVEATDMAIGIVSAKRYKMEKHNNYDITRLQDRYRSINIAKNRDGDADMALGLLFLGENGYFEELPRSNEITEEHYREVESYQKQFNPEGGVKVEADQPFRITR